jgi:hypothetical protein
LKQCRYVLRRLSLFTFARRFRFCITLTFKSRSVIMEFVIAFASIREGCFEIAIVDYNRGLQVVALMSLLVGRV